MRVARLFHPLLQLLVRSIAVVLAFLFFPPVLASRGLRSGSKRRPVPPTSGGRSLLVSAPKPNGGRLILRKRKGSKQSAA